MILLICNSNMFVPTVLTEVLSHPEKQYLVASDTKNICTFFRETNIENVSFVCYSRPRENYGKFSIFLPRKWFVRELLEKEIDEVVFFHTEFGGIINWLILYLSRKGVPVKFCRVFDRLPYPKAKLKFRTFKVWLNTILDTHVSMEMLDDGNRIFPSIPKHFYQNVKAMGITMPVDYMLIGKAIGDMLKKYSLAGRFVLLNGTVVSVGLVAKRVYEECINKVIGLLGVENVVSKCHPRFSSFYGDENKLKQIPSYIPANLILRNFDCYIGYESTLLVEAAMAGKISISLLELMSPIKEESKIQIHALFESRLDGRGIILFPKTLEELKKMIDA